MGYVTFMNILMLKYLAMNHYYSEQYHELQKEPVLYAWEIDHAPPYAWSSSLLMGAVYWIIGLGFFIFDDRHVAGQLTLFFMVLGLISVFYCRYLTDPNQLYHYRMTAKGIYYSQQDNIPAMAYTIARGISWLLILVSLIAMGLVGPLALAGRCSPYVLSSIFTPPYNQDLVLFGS